MKRRALAVLLAILLLAALTIPAYAVEPYDAQWVPPVPDFIVPTRNGYRIPSDVTIDDPYEQDAYQEVNDFAENLSTFLVLLDQGVYNRYKEENGIDYDRQYSIYIVAPDKKADGSRYDFGFFEHMGGPRHQQQMSVPGPMTYYCGNNPHSFIKYIYDEKANQLVLQPSLSRLPGGSGSRIRFTYVLAGGDPSTVVNGFREIKNGPFSETSEVYPGFTRFCGKDFGVGTIYQQLVDGKAVEHWRDHDWWLGIDGDPIPPYNPNLDKDQDTDGDGKPDINIDTDGDGQPDLNIDTDGDGKPDINIDTDGDGEADVNIDLDGDGKPDINIDTDGDRKPDLNIDTDGDKKPDVNIDVDGDGKPDVNVRPGEGSGGGSSGSGSGSGSEPGSGGSSSGGGSDSGSGSSGSGGGGSEGEGPGSGGGSSGSEGPGSGGGSSSDVGSGPPDTWFDAPDTGLSFDAWSFFNPFASIYKPFSWDSRYDPLEGYEPGQMPEFPRAGDPNYGAKDPFDIPNDLKFKDFAIEFEKGEGN